MSDSRFDSLAPEEYRYRDEDVINVLSERAFLRYKLEVEFAIVKALCRWEKCTTSTVEDFEQAIKQVTIEEVYALELETGHDIQSMIDTLKKYLKPENHKFVHRFATSYDIVETANAMRYRDVFRQVILPRIRTLMEEMIVVCRREAETKQIGRSHGQAGLPITYGFAVGSYINRLGDCHKQMLEMVNGLRGKFSGAMGAYNALTFFGMNPIMFEKAVLSELEIVPAEISTQIVAPEPFTRLVGTMCDAAGIVANMARDNRCLQRTEINEVREPVKEKQHGSSTMKQKRNPVGNENMESLWTVLCGLRTLLSFDAISEHQRDLTGSARSRMYPVMVNFAGYMFNRMTGIVKGMEVDRKRMGENLSIHRYGLAGEPLYLILGELGHPDAPAASKNICLRAIETQCSVLDVMKEDPSLTTYIDSMDADQLQVLQRPEIYYGQSVERANYISNIWESTLSPV